MIKLVVAVFEDRLGEPYPPRTFWPPDRTSDQASRAGKVEHHSRPPRPGFPPQNQQMRLM